MILLDIADVSKLPLWILVTAVILVCIVIILLSIISIRQGREVTLWGIKIGKKESATAPPMLRYGAQPLEDYGIKILSPERNTEHGNIIVVSGTYTRTPPAGEIRAIVLNKETNEYWPKKEPIFDRVNRTWSTEMNIGTDKPGYRRIIICHVGQNARDLIEYYKKVSSRMCYVGINYNHTFREDMYAIASVDVKVNPD